MRIFIILLVVLLVVGFAVSRISSYFSAEKTKGRVNKAAHSQVDPIPEDPTVSPSMAPRETKGTTWRATAVQKIGSYKFKFRQAPAIPSIFKRPESMLDADLDIVSNSWVYMGVPAMVDQLLQVAQLIDADQMEFDLDFCLVMLNRDKLSERGLSIFFNEGASWLSMLRLQADGGSLRLAAGQFAFDFDFSNTSDLASVVSVPSIRTLDGQSWAFETKTEVPVPRSDISDGTIRQSLDFRSVGFGLEGVTRLHGDKLVLDIKQKNGAVTNRQLSGMEVPEFQVQTLQTSLKMSFDEWSVLGGINVEKEELRQGLFRKNAVTSADYLVIFVRPRLSLAAPPKAMPVQIGDDHPLLPPKRLKTFSGLQLPN